MNMDKNKAVQPATTGQMAQTMGISGPNVIEQAKRAIERFTPGQIVRLLDRGLMINYGDRRGCASTVRILGYDEATEKYKGVLLTTDHPYVRTGIEISFSPDRLDTGE